MKPIRLILSAVLVLVGLYLIVGGDNFTTPEMAATGDGTTPRMAKYEFQSLFENQTLTSSLAVPGKYTVVEGYLDSCGICKRLEAKFPAFLDAREDVVIRQVRFQERNTISFTSREQIENYVARMNLYKNNRFTFDGKQLNVNTCGTPHIEIYGPDGRIVATDLCGADSNDKTGSAYLNNWIAAEIN